MAVTWFSRSRFGWQVIALRDNEPYAVSRGVPLSRTRLATFAFSAIFPGAIGAVYAQYVRSASPDMFGFSFLTLALSMLLLGGTGTRLGTDRGRVRVHDPVRGDDPARPGPLSRHGRADRHGAPLLS